MLPYLNWGDWRISVYALCYALMYAVLGVYGYWHLRRLIASAEVRSRLTLLFLSGLFAGTMLDVIVKSLLYWARTGVWVRMGHISALWGLAFGLGLGIWAMRRMKIPLGAGADVGVVPIPLGQAIGRLGCLAAGCCGGAPAPLGWGLWLPDTSGVWLNRYPTQLISLALNLFIFLLLLALERQPAGSRWRPFPGSMLAIYVLLFSAKRFGVEFLRADYQPVLGPFSVPHLAALLMFAAALLAWLYLTKTRRSSKPD